MNRDPGLEHQHLQRFAPRAGAPERLEHAQRRREGEIDRRSDVLDEAVREARHLASGHRSARPGKRSRNRPLNERAFASFANDLHGLHLTLGASGFGATRAASNSSWRTLVEKIMVEAGTAGWQAGNPIDDEPALLTDGQACQRARDVRDESARIRVGASNRSRNRA